MYAAYVGKRPGRKAGLATLPSAPRFIGFACYRCRTKNRKRCRQQKEKVGIETKGPVATCHEILISPPPPCLCLFTHLLWTHWPQNACNNFKIWWFSPSLTYMVNRKCKSMQYSSGGRAGASRECTWEGREIKDGGVGRPAAIPPSAYLTHIWHSS